MIGVTEKAFTLGAILRKLPVRRSYSTIYRWATYGAASANGEDVKLETILIGGVRHTST